MSGIDEVELKDKWQCIQDKVFRYADKDGRKAVKSILSNFN